MEKLQEELLEEWEKERKELSELLQSPGWALLVKSLDGVRRRLRNEILFAADDGLDGLISMAKAKSELAGVEFAASHPNMLLQELSDNINNYYEDLQHEQMEE